MDAVGGQPKEGDEESINTDLASRVIKEAIEGTIGVTQQYDEALAPKWVNKICEETMDLLVKHQKPLKYVVTCYIMRNSGGGLHMFSSAFWDCGGNDNMFMHKDEANRFMHCVVCVYWTTL
eukprot:Hpha_TRINITY_DN3646_c0_g1::TRINITY_DN3646_c0_g1_i1::g.877::m.877/K10420/DYNLT; dynein light chain Tctex-type 1